MRIMKHINMKKMIHKYNYIIGWGTGPIMKMNYKTDYFKLDFLIDGTEKQDGQIYKEINIKSPTILNGLTGHKLIIIYAIYEKEILKQISEYGDENTDVIIYAFLNITLKNGYSVPRVYAKTCEDILLVSLINQIGLDTIKYIEIGVCHPIIRNNTFMLNEIYGETQGYQGCLVEANPMCWELIEEYRKKDTLIKAGIGTEENESEMIFYAFPDLLGHSTFKKEIADKIKEKGCVCRKYKIPVIALNQLIENYFADTPDILAIDAEGFDYEILCSWDSQKYPFKIIVSEIMDGTEEPIEKIMLKKGYKIYAKTMENILWVKQEYVVFI